jgi:HTH-type transcriptional regulator / antitoxin HipB
VKSNNITTLDEHLDRHYGAKGTWTRQAFEVQSLAFRVGERIKEERLAANLTQEELALKSGTQATQISKIENGNAEISFSNLQNYWGMYVNAYVHKKGKSFILVEIAKFLSEKHLTRI